MHWTVKELKAIRLEKKISSSELSRMCNHSRYWWSYYERGRMDPRISDLEKAADALGYDVDLILR